MDGAADHRSKADEARPTPSGEKTSLAQSRVTTDPPAPVVPPAGPQPAPAPHPPEDAHAGGAPANPRKKWLIRAGLVAGVAVLGYLLVPWIITALNTVSTDDAYVSGHVTFVAPRVAGQVLEVLVDDNVHVKKGALLVRLDPEPYQVQVALKKAAVEVAEANLVAAQAQVRSQMAQARANRYKLEHAIEEVNNQIANLGAAVATLKSRQATLTLAKANLKRGEELVSSGGISKEDLDQRRQTVKVNEAMVDQALQQVYAIRAGLGLPVHPPEGKDLASVPPDLDQNFSAVRQALGDLLQSAAQFGYFPTTWTAGPKEAIETFYRQDPINRIFAPASRNFSALGQALDYLLRSATQFGYLPASWAAGLREASADVYNQALNRIYEHLIPLAPAIKQAEAKLDEARRDLAQAELNLRYTNIVSEIDGVVTRRNVNPGNNVQVGQSLMAVRSLTEIWVDANFKETQLADLRIGQRVRLEVDMYGSRHEFEGRITGFTMGTGQTLALLPPENATGNFVKIVQRLPVRIELTNYDPDKLPLFIGTSVVPYVYYKEPAEGPNKGKFLQPFSPLPQPPMGPKHGSWWWWESR
jgi:membrane fusion protein (multidrug efflux system)